MQTTDSDELFTVNKIIPRIDSNGELLINEEIINFLLEPKNFEKSSRISNCCLLLRIFREFLTVTFRGEKSAHRKMARKSMFELLVGEYDASRPVDQKMSPEIFSKNVF